MVRRFETDPIDRDERLGEAIEAYLALAEGGEPPDPEVFAARYPELNDDLRAALEGLALVRGLVGDGGGPGHRLESGRRIAGYRIVRELGRGGMGTVYEAVHVGLDRPVALKVLGTHATPDSTGRRRFLNEARTAAGLHHTHIVPVFDVGQVGGLCYYAMQRIEGSGLDLVLRHLRRDRAVAAGTSQGSNTPAQGNSGWLGWTPRLFGNTADPGPSHRSVDETATWFGQSRSEGSSPGVPSVGRERDDEPPPFDPPRGSAYYRWVAEVGREAAEALAHAHRRGVVHRDVKPSNLLVDARGVVWVADFGLARRLADPGLTQHDSLLGTPRYMSPEQAKTGPIDGRTDVYSLGATLYELLTLRPPFQGQTAAELIAQIGGREPAPLRQFDPRIPRDLETIVLKALAKRPADRYATAGDMAEDLERFLHHEPVRARRISPIGRAWRFTRRHPGASAVSAVAAATVLVVATAAFVRVVQERDQTRAAIMNQLWRESTVVRLSNVPNRRATGLNLLKEAAALGPEPALRTKLRDEAVEFLVLRDIKASAEFSTGSARGLVFGADGARLGVLTEGDGAEFNLWDVAKRTRLAHHSLMTARTAPASSGSAPGTNRPRGQIHSGIASAGPFITVVRADGQGLRVFDATTGAPVRDLEMPDRHILSFLAAPDGQRLVTIEGVLEQPATATADTKTPRPRERDGGRRTFRAFEVCLYSFERVAKPIATLARWETGTPGREFSFPIVSISPDGKTVATARYNDTPVSIWSADDGRKLEEIPIEAQTELTALALGPHGLLAVAGSGTIRLWEINSGTPLPGFNPYQSYVRFLRFNPRGSLLAVAGTGSDIELWDPATNSVVAVLPTPDRVEDLAFAPDGRTLAAAGRGSTTSLWDVVDPVARVQISRFESPVSALAFRNDGLLAMGSLSGGVYFWRPGQCAGATQRVCSGEGTGNGTNPGMPAKRLDGLKPTALSFDNEERLITVDPETLGRSSPGTPKNAEPIRTPLPELRNGGWSRGPAPLARTLGGRTMFIGRGSKIFVWHSDDPDQFQTFALPLPTEPTEADRRKGDTKGRRRGGESPSWRQLAANRAGDRLYLISVSGEVHALALEGPRGRYLDWQFPTSATTLTVSPDGETLAIGDHHGNVTLIDTTNGATRSRLSLPSGETGGQIQSLAFAPDGQELAVGTNQGHVEIWSLADTTTPLLRLPSHRGFITALAYGPTGRYLASGGSDKMVAVWDLDRIRTELGRIGLAW